jgi:hypothetical protein
MSLLPQAGAGIGRCRAASGDEASMVVRKEEQRRQIPQKLRELNSLLIFFWIGLVCCRRSRGASK